MRGPCALALSWVPALSLSLYLRKQAFQDSLRTRRRPRTCDNDPRACLVAQDDILRYARAGS